MNVVERMDVLRCFTESKWPLKLSERVKYSNILSLLQVQGH